MASLHLPAPHQDAYTAHPASASSPPSPDALAAAVTLATLAESRPEGDAEDTVEDDDDDLGGGISLVDHHFDDAAMASAFAMDEEEDMVVSVQSTLLSFDSFVPLPTSNSGSYYDGLTIWPPIHLHVPAPPVFVSHLSSSEQSLEPPPTLQEAHLSIQDKTSFAPITSFFHYLSREKSAVLGLDLVLTPTTIHREHLAGDKCDHQGINWAERNTTRAAIRAKRDEFEGEKLSQGLKEVRRWIPPMPATDNFFQFRQNNTTPRAFFPHFQLRNVLAATSRNDIFYAAGHRVFRTDAQGTTADVITDLTKSLAIDGSITTIAATDNVLVAGAFEGEYAICDLSSTYGSACTFGRTTDHAPDTKTKIVNHMHLFEPRTTYAPHAVLCSNDNRVRTLDCVTDTFTHSFLYPAAVNCAATSPNGRMRVIVGDFQETLITNAETGRPFETLNSHSDDAFACAWADDGIHVATAAQDSTIVVWDARYWAKPLTVMASELSVPRSLRFSPVGSGPRVLIAAEADDYINIINAQTFESKQVFDVFGPIGGVALTPDGQSLLIANGERRFGGIVELERTGWAERTARRMSRGNADWDDLMTDWAHDDALDDDERVCSGIVARQRRPVDLGHLVV